MENKQKTYKLIKATKIGANKWEVECQSSLGTPIRYIDRTPGKKHADVVAWAKRWCEKQNSKDTEADQLRYRRMMTIKFLMSEGKASDLGFLKNLDEG